MLCVIIFHKWRDLQFKVDSERQIFEKIFYENLIRVYTRNLLKRSRRRNILSYIVLLEISDLEFEPDSQV